MKRSLIIASIASLSLSGCMQGVSDREMTGGAIGALGGAAIASAFDVSAGWTVVSALAGAAAGTLIARNTAKNQCAYANGDGTYRTVPC
ncbi:glucose-6-phosphate isomerase [Roseovarius sp.]|uniref:glucose-6-phosphate isomerase n=1 Tax=Roseovarius sp. TaxID=1486281 RepID=UPI003A97A651